jgi:predicted site-specific integrase-resolvase
VTVADLDARLMTLGPDEAARRLGVESSTLANWRWSGRGPKYVKLGGRVRYRASDLADYLDAQTRASTSDPGPTAD